MMVGIRVNRIECDELWSYVGHKRNRRKAPRRSRQSKAINTLTSLWPLPKAIIGYRTGKRTSETTDVSFGTCASA